MDALGGRRVLVTGGSGFIGSRLSARLRSLGADVYVTSRTGVDSASDDRRRLRADLASLDETRVVFAAARPDLVFHLASRVTGGRELDLVQATLLDNLIATVNVLMVATEGGNPRVVLAGSMEEPGFDGPIAVPPSPYAAAKWSASNYARMFHALYGLPVVNLRVFMVYGPGQGEPRLIPYVMRSLLRGEAPQLTSGTRAIDWVYVDDVVEAFVLASTTAGIEGELLDIGSGESVTIRRLVEKIVAMVDPEIDPVFGAVADRPLETSNVADVRRTEAKLDWRPATSLDDGLKATLEWLAQRQGIEPADASA